MNHFQSNLKNDLKKYGLNPAEWVISQLAESRFQVVHIKDHDFYFVGQTLQETTSGLPRWTELKLFSL